MKKILSLSLLFAVVMAVSTGCLKDKGFDNHEYGINSPETSPVGIGLPLAASPQNIGVDLSGSSQTVSDILVANLLSGSPASADIKVNLTLNPTLVADYNTANGTSVQPLPTAVYTLPSTTIVIKAGQSLGKLVITLPSTLSLNANITYGLGFTISSVDAGYVIAKNLKDLVVIINVKNKYDGIYRLTGYHNRTPYTFPFDIKVNMITTGPNSVALYYPPFGDYGQPIGTAPGVVSWYGAAVSPNFGFDLVTNLATTITGMPGSGVTYGYATDPGIVNKYDPALKKMTLCWQYNGNALRRFYDTLVYVGPR